MYELYVAVNVITLVLFYFLP